MQATFVSGGYLVYNRKLKDELLNREIFTTLIEAKILIEQWRKEYNQLRPPAPEVRIPVTLEVVSFVEAGYGYLA